MRTPKELYHSERIIYKPELPACPQCGGPLVTYNYLAWDKTVQTLERVLSVASRPGRCADPACAGYNMRLLSAEGQQIAMPGSTYGYDVLVRIGWLRQEQRATYDEIQDALRGQVQISVSHVRHLYQQTYLPLLACHERQQWARLEQAVQQHQGLMIALDGLAPEGGEPQLWFIRELLTGCTLRSGWLSRQDQATFEAFLKSLTTDLPGPVLAVVSDKQRGLVPAVAAVLPHSQHQFCHAHYLKNLSEPLAKVDEAFKVDLRKAIRQEVGPLVRSEGADEAPESGVLTVTGVLPTPLPTETETPTDEPEQRLLVEEEEMVTALTRRARYLLTLKGRPPFRLAGIEMYQRFQDLVLLTDDLLAHRHEPRLARLTKGVQQVLSQYAGEYQDLQQGAGWLQDIAALLVPGDTHRSGRIVAQQLQTYLDDLSAQHDLSSPLVAFRHQLHKVSRSYGPGLFYCYDQEGLPRTNNGLESHFRDRQRQLLRTTGQKGQTRRAIQRIGAWELLPRPSTEALRQTALCQVPWAELQQERTRFRQHQLRFQLHTRSTRHTQAQFDKLRQRWLALPRAPTG